MRKKRQIWDKMFSRVDNTMIPCHTNVIRQKNWSGLALGAIGAQVGPSHTVGQKAPKSAFKTRYMTYNE